MDWLIQLLIVLCIVIVIIWAIRQLAAYLPGPLPVIIQVFVVVIACLWLLSMFGGLSGFNGGHFGHITGPCG